MREYRKHIRYNVIPKPLVVPTIPGLVMDGNRMVSVKQVPVHRRRRDQMTAEELGITDHDADGYPIYEE